MGLPAIRSGPWTPEQVSDYLSSAVIPVRLASAGRTHPLVQSLWFLPAGGDLWCCTQADSVLARRLAADGRCGFEVSADAPPYRGVRGTGVASMVPEEAASVLPRLIERYLGSQTSALSDWLLSRLESEVAIRISDLAITSWDYSPRM